MTTREWSFTAGIPAEPQVLTLRVELVKIVTFGRNLGGKAGLRLER
jgi:hypothetical protein